MRLKLLGFITILISLTAYGTNNIRTTELDIKFQNVRRLFFKVYSPIIKEKASLHLAIQLDHDSPKYFGGMTIDQGNLTISVGSEAHLDPSVTVDSYLATLCHEVGHRLGGTPYKTSHENRSWASTEGQSDYYAATVCLKEIYSKDPATLLMKFPHLPHNLSVACDQIYPDKLTKQICLRTLNAGYEMTGQLHAIYLDFASPPPRPDFLTPETEGQSVGLMYPSLQCRLDTFVHGALNKPRPLCWFKPEDIQNK